MGETRTVVRRRIGRRIASGDVGRKPSSTGHRGTSCVVRTDRCLYAVAAEARSISNGVLRLYPVFYTLYFFDGESR